MPVNVQDLISVTEVMEELGLGPNGGLVYCMEYLLENTDWLEEQLSSFGEDDYLILDCPGQIELYVAKQCEERKRPIVRCCGLQVREGRV